MLRAARVLHKAWRLARHSTGPRHQAGRQTKSHSFSNSVEEENPSSIFEEPAMQHCAVNTKRRWYLMNDRHKAAVPQRAAGLPTPGAERFMFQPSSEALLSISNSTLFLDLEQTLKHIFFNICELQASRFQPCESNNDNSRHCNDSDGIETRGSASRSLLRLADPRLMDICRKKYLQSSSDSSKG